ncbi:MAG: hypothetical protein Q7S01_01450 [bacterium]|nr:hypothetical protein [bacterium]
MEISSISNFFAYVPTDWIIIVALAVIASFDAIRSGMGRQVALALSLPVALLFSTSLQSAKFLSGILPQIGTPILKAAFFGVLFVVAYFLIRRMTESYGSGSGAVIQAVVAGVATTAIIVIIWLQVPELQAIWNFGPQVQAVFAEAYRFWWLLGSYVALAFVRG